ncbi:T9SS type B sorting domain-containing protein [Chryseobacterium koreense]|uniref:T9SS type B sorting domain-containing protein n=1 Tax=Chryseobacterium koreense TaxID=232216 RepID=UPI0026EE1EA8|nr:T9SS type B sorting domain-containing protein [Chryseobacterium koreense]
MFNKKYIILLLTIVFNLCTAQTFSSVGGIIAKNDYTIFDITVSGVGNLNSNHGLEKVCVNINFPHDENLKLVLRSPFGSMILLSDNNGGQGSDYIGTCFDGVSTNTIVLGEAPFTGNFLPESSLGILNNNQPGDGKWSLIIWNNSTSLSGNLINWTLTFGDNPVITPPVPPYPDCTFNMPTTCTTEAFCDYGKSFCGVYNNAYGMPAANPQKGYLKFKASGKNASFRVWIRNGGPDRDIGGYLPIELYVSFYKSDCITSGSPPLVSYVLTYNLNTLPDTNYYELKLNDILEECQLYTIKLEGINNKCYFEYAIEQTSGINTKEIVVDPPTAKICAGDSVDLNVIQGCGPFIWSPSTGLNTSTGSHVVASPTETTIYKVSSTGACSKTKDVLVEVVPKPIANAGPDQTKCSNIFQMNANVPASGENGFWKIISGNVSPNVSSDPKQIFVLNSQTATLRWTVSNGICSVFDDVKLVNTLPSNINLSFSYESPVCIKKYNFLSPQLPVNFSPGGIFSSTPGLVINPVTGVINLAQSSPGNYIVNYNKYVNPTCGIVDYGAFIEIKAYTNPVLNFSFPNTICNDVVSVLPNLPTGFQLGGTFSSSSPNLSINTTTGMIDVANSQNGVYTITYLYPGSLADCIAPNTYSQQVSVLSKPQYTQNLDVFSCNITGTGIGSFDLLSTKASLTLETNATVTFFETLQDAEQNQNSIINTSSYPNEVPNHDIIFARISVPNKCTVYATLDLYVRENVYSETLGEGPYYVCNGTLLELDAGAGFSAYEWSPTNETTQKIKVNTPGEYCVKITSTEGCSSVQCVLVKEADLPEFNIEVISNNLVVHVTSGNAPFEYSLDGITWQNENQFPYSKGTTYTIFVREKSKAGCVASKTIHIPFIPNVITPNGDGINDFWDLSTLSFYSGTIKVKLFSQYGNLVKELTINDGKNLANIEIKLPTGTYWYLIEIPNFALLKGWLLVKNR